MKLSAISCLVFVLSWATISYGQTINSQSLSGTVTDPSGAVVVNATVTVTNTGTGLTTTVKSNADGNFTALDLPIGTYTVTTTAPGFKASVVSGVILSVAGNPRIQVPLQVGESTQSVSVAANPAQIETTTSEIGGVITGEESTKLLLDGRNYVQLLTLLPGVSQTTSNGFNLFSTDGEQGSSQTVDGDRSDSTNFYIDGIDNKDNGGGGNNYVSISPDFIQELKVSSTTYDASYGGDSGATVSVALKSGTKSFHGIAYEFLRNAATQGYAFQPLGTTKPTKPPLVYNDFGWALGGPLYIPGHFNANKDKLFFFGGEEYKRSRVFSLATDSFPTANQKVGNFSQYPSTQWPINPVTNQPFPGGIVPSCGNAATSGCATANGLALASLFPTPNAGSNFIFTNPNPINTYENLIKIDYVANEKNHISGDLVIDGYDEFSGYGNLVTHWDVNGGFTSSIQGTHTFNEKTLNTLTGSYSGNRLNQNQDTSPNKLFGLGSITRTGNGLNYSTLFNASPDIPGTSVTGFSGLGAAALNQDNYQRIYAGRDDFSKIIGNHSLRLGIYAWRSRKNQTAPGAINGSFGFTANSGQSGQLAANQALSNELMGLFATYNEASNVQQIWARFTQIEPYVQDDWAVSHRLVLNLGLRWEYLGPQYSALNNIATFLPQYYVPADADTVNSSGVITSAPYPFNGLVLAGNGFPAQANGRVYGYGNPAFESLFHKLPQALTVTDWNCWAPRVGFAYNLGGAFKAIVLRGGFGITYERLEGNYLFNSASQDPFTNVTDLLSGNITNIGAAASAAEQVNNITNSHAPNLIPPRDLNWSFGIQQQLTPDTVFELNYVGSESGNLVWSQNLNQEPAGTTQAHPGVSSYALSPYLGYENIMQFVNGAANNYNGLQAQLLKRMTKGGTVRVAYTWSKNLTDESTFGTHPQNAFNLMGEYSQSNDSEPQILVASYVYPLPFWLNSDEWYKKELGGWLVSGVTRISSGTPLTVNDPSNTDVSGDGVTEFSQRPNLVGNPYEKGFDLYLNSAAFVEAAPGTFGALRPNAIRGPIFNEWDTSLQKLFKIRENIGMEFRADMFNVPNHFSDFGVQTTLGNGNFGDKTSASDPRTMEFALKLHF